MDRTTWPLPIRLVPRRGGQIFSIAFFTFFTGFAIFWIAMAASGTWFADLNGDGVHWASNLFPLFGLIFVAVGGAGLVNAIAKLLPGSPYHHLLISANGLTIRTMRRTRHHRWEELSPFDVSVRKSRDKDGDVSYSYYVVAIAAADADKLADNDERYNRSVFRIDADEFGAESAQTDAAELASWFTALRQSALDRRLSATEEVSVPPGFRASVWTGAVSSTEGAVRSEPQNMPSTDRRSSDGGERPSTVQRQ